MAEKWEAAGETGMRKGKWTVGKFMVNGVWKYRLWDGDKPIGIYASFQECKDASRKRLQPILVG